MIELINMHQQKGKKKKQWAINCELQDLKEVDKIKIKLTRQQIKNKIHPHMNKGLFYGYVQIMDIKDDRLHLKYYDQHLILNSQDFLSTTNYKKFYDHLIIKDFKYRNREELDEIRKNVKKIVNSFSKIKNRIPSKQFNQIHDLKVWSNLSMEFKSLNQRLNND